MIYNFRRRRYSFVSAKDVATAMGFPSEHETLRKAYWTMLVVTVPAQTDLCINGTLNSDEGSSRKKRDVMLLSTPLRNRRETGMRQFTIL